MGCFAVLRNKKKKPDRVIRSSHGHTSSQPSKLPEPEAVCRSLQSAPPSFRNRPKNAQPTTQPTNTRIRALSAPSTLDVPGRDHLASAGVEEEDESKSRSGMGKDQRLPSPQPLPLPSPQGISVLKSLGSIKMSNANSSTFSGPLPLPPFGALRSFSSKEIAAACQNFSADSCVLEGVSSVVYKASFGEDTSNKKFEATVTCLLPSSQGFKEFVNEVNIIASLQHPQLCKLLGFHAYEGSDGRMLVYERLFHGSLDRLLYGKSEGPCLDWASRLKIAICTAKGLAYLHEEGPFQAMYNEFSAANIQIDKDFSAKLSGYGCVSYNPEAEISNASAAANVSIETLERGVLTPKSNVWSFGIVLLELLIGKKHLDSYLPREERNLVKWSKPYLTDESRLSLIMDSRLKGRFPPKAARTVADIALKCLQKDPSERPTMRAVLESLENIQDIKYSCRYPLLEPSAVAGKQFARSPSLNGMATRSSSKTNFSRSSPARASLSISPQRTSLSIPLPPLTCASTLSLEDYQRSIMTRLPSPKMGRASVEGF